MISLADLIKNKNNVYHLLSTSYKVTDIVVLYGISFNHYLSFLLAMAQIYYLPCVGHMLVDSKITILNSILISKLVFLISKL